MFKITSDYQSHNISDWCIFQIAFRFSKEFHIVSSDFRLLQILQNWHFKSVKEAALLSAADGKSQAAESMVQKMAISDDGEYLIHVVFLTADKVL